MILILALSRLFFDLKSRNWDGRVAIYQTDENTES